MYNYTFYYSLIYPYLTYGIINVVGKHLYISNLNPIITLQKRVVRIIISSKFDHHSSPLFKNLNILKLVDLVFLNNALFMYDYHITGIFLLHLITYSNRSHQYLYS